jgi:hypothetical protein
MRHRYDSPTAQGVPALVEYGWRLANEWTHMRIAPVGTGVAAAVGSEKAFITEHYWGYTRQRDGSTVEYQVAHPRWRVWSAGSIQLSGNVAATYGPVFGSILTSPPSSAFLADGSAIVVGRPMALSDGNRP